jgi:hypothetical protein
MYTDCHCAKVFEFVNVLDWRAFEARAHGDVLTATSIPKHQRSEIQVREIMPL